MNLLNRTWAAGAKPIGAPGWPAFAVKVASTWRVYISSVRTREFGVEPVETSRKIVKQEVGHSTHSQKSYGVDGSPVNLSVTHDCCIGVVER